MESYRPKTALASAADHLLRVLLAWAAGVGWFVALWGLCLPALTAGTALGGLFWLCARLLGKKQVQKKEAGLASDAGRRAGAGKAAAGLPRRGGFSVCPMAASPNAASNRKRRFGHVGRRDRAVSAVCPASRNGNQLSAGQRNHPEGSSGSGAAHSAVHHRAAVFGRLAVWQKRRNRLSGWWDGKS